MDRFVRVAGQGLLPIVEGLDMVKRMTSLVHEGSLAQELTQAVEYCKAEM